MIWNTQRMDYFAADSFSGMVKACPDRWQCFSSGKNSGTLIKKNPDLDQFAIVISGGAGNGPLFPGYVGEGLADAAVIGAPFAAPNAYAIYEVGKYLGQNKGVLLLYNNFAGDYLNNDMAQELLEIDGIAVETVVSCDDVATALDEPKTNRSGRCGIGLLIKLAGSCAQRGWSLKDTAQLLRQASTRLGTISLHVDFHTKQIAYGAGFSGEPGIKTTPLVDMQPAAAEALAILINDLQPAQDEKLYVLVNRLRLTSYADSYIMANTVHEQLAAKYLVEKMHVATYSNIIDTYGFNFSILCMDAQISKLLNEDVSTDSFII